MEYRLLQFIKYSYPLILLTVLAISFSAYAGGKFGRKPKPAPASDSAATVPSPCQPEKLPDCTIDPKCDPQLEAFKSDCVLQCQFNALKDAYKKYGINPEYLTEYRSSRLIAIKDFKPSAIRQGQEIFRPWEIYRPKPKTWVEWERGNFYREQLNKTLNLRQKQNEGRWELKLQDLQDLHQKYLDRDLVSSVPFLYRFKSFQTKYPLPGSLRKEGSTVSGFTATVSLEDLKGLKELQETKTSETGEPYIDFKIKRKLGWKTEVEVKYLKPYFAEKAAIDLIDEINKDVNGFISKTKKDESPLEFAARIQRKFIAIHPFHEGNGRMSRFIQDLISRTLDLPLIPGGNLQNDIATRLDRYQKKTREEVVSGLMQLSRCLKEYQDKECYSKLPENKRVLAISGRCKPIYGENPKIEQGVITRLVQDICASKTGAGLDDTAEKIEEMKTQMADIAACMQTTQRPNWSSEYLMSRQMTNEAKVEFIEALAEPLKEDLVAYTWVTGKPEAFSRKHIYTRSSIFNRFILGSESQIVKGKTNAGNGLYVSKNPYDSREFAVPEEIRLQFDALPRPGDVTYDWKRAEDFDKQVITQGHLLRVEIKKGQKVLDLRNKRVFDTLETHHLNSDVFQLNPNVVIDGYIRGTEWMNIKLTDNNAFSVRDATYADFSLKDAVETAFTLNLYIHSVISSPFGRHFLKSMVEHHKKKLDESFEIWKAKSEIGSTFFDPFLIKCHKYIQDNGKPKLIRDKLFQCNTKEYEHIPDIRDRVNRQRIEEEARLLRESKGGG